MKRFALALSLLAAACIPALAQTNVDRIEYFFDSDPGIGNGTAIPVTAGPIQNVNVSINTSALTTGFHTLVIRARHQTTNVWGVEDSRVIYVASESVGTLAQVNTLEYYIDSDPGQGNGTSVGISGSPTNIDETPAIPTSSLPVGFHVLHMRVQDNDGNWGIPFSRAFYVGQGSVDDDATLSHFEYFFDSDPGVGAGIAIGFGSGITQIELDRLIELAALPEGFHTISIRVKDVDGQWGIADSRAFYIDQFTQISSLEYFIDTDPGEGSATAVTITPGGAIDETFTITTNPIAGGSHTFGARVARTDGSWGSTTTTTFSLLEAQTITFNSLAAVTFGDASFDLTGSSSSGLEVTYNSSNPLVATISGNTVTIVGAGTTVITASQPGDGSFAPASDEAHTLTVNKASQTISFGTLPAKAVGDPSFTLSGTTTAALSIIYTSSNTAVATVSGNTVSIIAAGTTDITASQPGNGNYNAAINVVRPLVVESTNNPPVLSITPGAMFYSNTAIVVNNTIIVADADGAIESATVAITSGFQSTEDQLLFSSQNGIDGTYNVGSGVLTLSGTASDVDYQTALRSVQYNNTSATPDTNDRTITFQLSDGVTTSASVATSVTINKPPVIEAPAKDTQAGGNVAFSIDDIFSDPDDNLDLPTLTVTSKQGALVTIRNGFITVNYSTIPDFQGTDELTMSICDLAGKCQTQIVTVDIGADVDVFNGVSANADGMNDFMRVKFLPPGTQVSIFNRWGDAVFETKDYDNNEVSKRFEGNGTDGNTLTAGTYFYKITLPDGRQRTGYLHLKR